MRRPFRIVPVLALALACAALALSAPAHAESWNCGDRIEEGGIWSVFRQSYHSPFQPPRPIAGPYQIVSGGGFYTGWYNRYDRLDAPFLAPDDMSINLDVPAPIKRGTAVFQRAGAAPVRVAFTGSSSPPDGGAPFVYIRVRDRADIAALLAAHDWTVTLYGAKGRQAARVAWHFPLVMAGLRALHARHVVNMLARQRDITGLCERDLTEEVI